MKDLIIKKLQTESDYISENCYELRELVQMTGGSTAHCSVYPVGVSDTLLNEFDELWYILEGEGKIWSENGAVHDYSADDSVYIPAGVKYQFKNGSTKPLKFHIIVIPPYDSQKQQVFKEGYWSKT